jgi:hypothetical protein
MLRPPAILCLALALPACEDSTAPVSPDDPSCTALKAEPAKPVTIRIENQTSQSIFIPDMCSLGGLDGVLVDGEAMLEPFSSFSCDGVLAEGCRRPDCFEGTFLEIAAGQVSEHVWSGHLLSPLFTAVPKGCASLTSSCLGKDPDTACRRRVAAPAGQHSLEIDYNLVPNFDGATKILKVPFSLPMAMVMAVIQ